MEDASDSVLWRLEQLEHVVGMPESSAQQQQQQQQQTLSETVSECLSQSMALETRLPQLRRFWTLYEAAAPVVEDTEAMAGAGWVEAHGREALLSASTQTDVVRAETAAVLVNRTLPQDTAAVFTAAPEHAQRLAAISRRHASQIAELSSLRNRILAIARTNATFTEAISTRIAVLDALQ